MNLIRAERTDIVLKNFIPAILVQKMNLLVCHITTVHSRTDTRIFLKECRSLTKAGYDVSLIVAKGNGDENSEGINIYDVGPSKNRLDRMTRITRRVLAKAKNLNAGIYHLHDPELIPIGLELKLMGKKVIFDAHEDLPKQLLSKPYLNRPSRAVLARAVRFMESFACRKFDAVITATPSIREKFKKINTNSIDINNFPIGGEPGADEPYWDQKEKQICYIGTITAIRGIKEIVRALELMQNDIRLQLAGRFGGNDLEMAVKDLSGWQKVDYRGWVNQKAVSNVLKRSMAGIVTFLPVPNHIDAQPNKMFEYMCAGIPVIASNFPLWRAIVEGNACGLCVNPLDPEEIARAIDFLANNPTAAAQMGKNGQEAVRARYNWEVEKQKLITLYNQIILS